MADSIFQALIRRPQLGPFEGVSPEVQDQLAREEQATWSPARRKLVGGIEGIGTFIKGLATGGDPTNPDWHPGFAEEAGAALQAGLPFLGASRGAVKAWHGSRKLFDKFSLDHVGKRMGTVRGPGTYLSGNRGVGEKYQPKPTPFIQSLGTKGEQYMDPVHQQLRLARDLSGSTRKEAIIESARKLNSANKFEFEDLIKHLDEFPNDPVKMKPGGYLYETKLDLDPERMIDLDEKVSDQSDIIRNAFDDPRYRERVTVDRKTGETRPAKGSDLIKRLHVRELQGNHETDKLPELFKTLRDRGVIGSYYENGTMPNNLAGESPLAYDYIMYEPERITIEKILNSFGNPTKKRK